MLRLEIKSWLVRVFYIFFLLFLLHRFLFVSSGMIEQTMSYVLYPFLRLHGAIARSIEHQEMHKKLVQDLYNEIDCLRIQNSLLKERLAQLQAQQIFIDQTQEVVDYAQRYDHESMSIASVLLEYTCPQEDVMFIEGGSNRHYAKDDVVVYKNALIGRIIEVYPWYSKVALITDQRCRISAIVGEDSQGILCGKNNMNLELNFVPHYKSVLVGDTIVSTGNGLVFPPGFALGIVESVATDLVAHKISVKPYFDFAEITYVYVLLKQNKNIEI